MRKYFCLMLVALLLCGCQAQPATGTDLQQTAAPEQASLTRYPLLFWDAADSDSRAYILCAFDNGDLRLTEDYLYSGEPLAAYISQENAPVSSDIFNSSLELSFRDPLGNHFQAFGDNMTCSGETLSESVSMRIALSHRPETGQFYLGTYRDANIPFLTGNGEQTICAELDGDGVLDLVSWTFTPADPDLYGELFHYTVTATVGDVSYRISGEEHLPCEKEGLCVFVADLDKDGCCEIILCVEGMSRFRSVVIYRIEEDRLATWLYHEIDHEP